MHLEKEITSAMGSQLKLHFQIVLFITLTLKVKLSGELGATSLEIHSFNQDKCWKSINRMFIKDNQLFTVVDDVGFRELL